MIINHTMPCLLCWYHLSMKHPLIMVLFSSFSSLKHYEMSGEIDYLQTLKPCLGGLGRVDSCMAGDDVVAGRILVHPFISNYPILRKACGKILFF